MIEFTIHRHYKCGACGAEFSSTIKTPCPYCGGKAGIDKDKYWKD